LHFVLDVGEKINPFWNQDQGWGVVVKRGKNITINVQPPEVPKHFYHLIGLFLLSCSGRDFKLTSLLAPISMDT
jgi:hypothetical protein